VRTAAADTTAGSIGFVGLVTPHLVRLVIGSSHRGVIPAAALAGGALLVVADLLARTVVAPRQLPVGALTALIGVPLFLLLMRRQ
jgi:iron complex transport system permease protein